MGKLWSEQSDITIGPFLVRGAFTAAVFSGAVNRYSQFFQTIDQTLILVILRVVS